MATYSSTSVTGQSESSYKLKRNLKSAGVMIVLVILTFICLFPIYILIINATRSHAEIVGSGISLVPGDMFFKNLVAMTKAPFNFNALIGFRNSFIIAGSATILTIFFSCLTAYGLCVYDFKIKNISYTFIIAVMMVPAQVTSVGFVSFMIDLELNSTWWPLIIPAVAAPAIVFFMCSNMKSTFPFDIIEAARIDGCGEFRTFLTIGLPMLKPAIAVQSIFAFVTNWNNLYMPSMIITSNRSELGTIPMMIQALMSQDKLPDQGATYAAIAITIIPLIIVYSILSKFIIEGVALGGVKE
ncbi:MAG: carbohydrate ABC transporter permease [Ruminococcus sp.]|jgi:multiple sugar transport system permease protein|nr:carbohydrate ABC transporter permease [Ruminococcus sp.]